MFLITVLIAILSLQSVCAKQTRDISLPEDAGLSPLELIVKYGYPLERHWAVTEDGYILNMHRIPHGLDNAGEENKPAILLQHGLLSSGADFVNSGTTSPAFFLADAGYDVWLGNARGTTYSRNHTTLNPDEKDFWLFSWHEIGYYDLPAKIDYIIETSGQDKIFYVGHSQGTTVSYVMGTSRPEYNAKLRLVVSLAPVAYMSNLLNPIFIVGSLMREDLANIIEDLGWYEILRHTDDSSLTDLCADGAPYQDICVSVLSMMGGYNRPQLNASMIPVYMTNAPAGISYRQLLHYAQGIVSGSFRLYDHGETENLEIYGQTVPPDYDLRQMTAPVALFYSENDWCAATVDVEQLYSELGSPVLLHKMEDPRFNHIDYIWAIDVIPQLFEKVLETLRLY